MGMRKLGLLLVLLFFLQSSSNPPQNPLTKPLVSAYEQKHNVGNGGTWKNELTKISFGQEVMVDRRGGGGHGGSESTGGGTLNSQPSENKSKSHHHGRNGCRSNHIGLARLVFLLLTSSFLIFIFHGF